MEFFDVLKARRSIRAYSDTPVEEEKINVWVGAFDEAAVKRILGLPPSHRPAVLLPVGYAVEEPRDRDMMNLADLVHRI